MIRINLHDYRDELRKIEIQKRVVKSLAIIISTSGLSIASRMVFACSSGILTSLVNISSSKSDNNMLPSTTKF